MRKNLLCVAATVAIVFAAGAARAADTLIYSMETGTATNPDGFGPNAGGTTSQDTIGATDGLHSLKYTVPAGATFTGALTGSVPGILNNPPGVGHVTFDMTIAQGDTFTGGFAVLGITMFGIGPGPSFGLQAQFSPLIHIDGKAPGTYKDLQIPLIGATNQVDFTPNQTFNQIFGSGPNQQTPSGLEFFINKSNDAPATVYIDNVRIGGNIPEPATCTLLAIGAAVAMMGFRRRRSR
ncbi:MAG TPA: PEP-CTERM sorting domain-containing protein [Lacipirellulaceae bacterium]|jgi:hypothetical protein